MRRADPAPLRLQADLDFIALDALARAAALWPEDDAAAVQARLLEAIAVQSRGLDHVAVLAVSAPEAVDPPARAEGLVYSRGRRFPGGGVWARNPGCRLAADLRWGLLSAHADVMDAMFERPGR
jgi:hypothetical protein